LFANLIVQYSDKVEINSFDADMVQKFYTMSLKVNCVSANGCNFEFVVNNLVLFETVLSELKNVRKNEKVLALLN
jgi:hypothetical protein